jgi:hypothetical protein
MVGLVKSAKLLNHLEQQIAYLAAAEPYKQYFGPAIEHSFVCSPSAIN